MRFLVLVSFLVGLAGCGGGGGEGDGDADPAAVRTGTVVIRGTVAKGPVGGAEVCAVGLAAGARTGDVRLTVEPGPDTPAGGNFCVLTSPDGSFVVTVPDSYQGDLLLEAWGGFFCTDETPTGSSGGCSAGGVTLALPGEPRLRTVIAIPASGTVTAQINPLSTAAVDSAGAFLSMRTFSARFAALARQLGLPDGVTTTTEATRSSHPYLLPATAHLLGAGTLEQVLAALRQGSSTFLPAPAPLGARTAADLSIDFDGAMAAAVMQGKDAFGRLVSNPSVQMHAIWRGNCYQDAPANCPAVPNQRSFEGRAYAISDEVRQRVDRTGGIERVQQTDSRKFVTFAPYMVQGQVDGGGRYSVTTERGQLPRDGKLGQNGLFRRYTTYTDASKATVYSTTTENWSIEANSASTLFGCFDAITRRAADGQEQRAKECFRIGAASQGLVDGDGGLLAIYSEQGLTYIYEGEPDREPVPVLRQRTPSDVAVDFNAAVERAFLQGMSAEAPGVGVVAGSTLRYAIGTELLAASENFEGAQRMANTVARTLDSRTTQVRVFFSTGPFTVHGSIAQERGDYSVTTATGALPAAGRLGDRGLFRRYSTYRNPTREELLSTTTVTWSLEADTATTLLGCFNSVVLGPAGAELRRASECFPVDASGRFTGPAQHTLRAVYTVQGFVTAYE